MENIIMGCVRGRCDPQKAVAAVEGKAVVGVGKMWKGERKCSVNGVGVSELVCKNEEGAMPKCLGEAV